MLNTESMLFVEISQYSNIPVIPVYFRGSYLELKSSHFRKQWTSLFSASGEEAQLLRHPSSQPGKNPFNSSLIIKGKTRSVSFWGHCCLSFSRKEMKNIPTISFLSGSHHFLLGHTQVPGWALLLTFLSTAGALEVIQSNRYPLHPSITHTTFCSEARSNSIHHALELGLRRMISFLTLSFVSLDRISTCHTRMLN